MESNDPNNKPPADLIERVKAHLRNVNANLKLGGPPVDWEELQLFVDGVLVPDRAESVRCRVETWRSWYNARLQLLVAMCNSEHTNGGGVE